MAKKQDEDQKTRVYNVIKEQQEKAMSDRKELDDLQGVLLLEKQRKEARDSEQQEREARQAYQRKLKQWEEEDKALRFKQ